MFAKVTKNLLKDIDENGRLIPVQCLDDSNKLHPLAVVFERKRFPFSFIAGKYDAKGFTLNDLIKNNDSIHPEVEEKVFLDYAGIFEDNFSASVDGGATVAGLVGLKAGLQGEGSSEVHSNIGTLYKQEVNIATLVRELDNKYLDKGHALLKQLGGLFSNTTLGFVSARVFNRNEFFISKQEGQGASSKANVNIHGVSIDGSGSFGKENKVKLRVPANTTLAYRFMKIKFNINDDQPICQFELQSGRIMSPSTLAASTFPITMEVLDPDATATQRPLQKSLPLRAMSLSGAIMSPSTLAASTLAASTFPITMEVLDPDATATQRPLQKSLALRELTRQLSPLGEESVDTRTTLLQLLTDIMVDQEALHTLEMAVDNVNMGLTPDVESVEQEAAKTQITSVLQLLPCSTSYHPLPLPYAMHLLITALTEMSCEALAALSSCSSPPVLQALHQMALVLDEEDSECAPLDPVLEQEDIYQHVESLFAASGVNLQREAGSVKISEKDFQVYPLGVAVTGLAVLARSE